MKYNEIMNDLYDPNFRKKTCPQVQCKKKPCCCGLRYVFVPSALTGAASPEKGRYSNAIVQYEETGEVYIYSAEGIPVLVKEGNAA